MLCRKSLCDQVVTIKLDRQQLPSLRLQPFSRLSGARSLHLQHNCLSTVPELAPALPCLRFLSLAHNQLTSFLGLEHFSSLATLDVSHNEVQALEATHLPASLIFLKVANNPCSRQLPLGLKTVLARLPVLKELDGVSVTAHLREGATNLTDEQDLEALLNASMATSASASDVGDEDSDASGESDTCIDAEGQPADCDPVQATDRKSAPEQPTAASTASELSHPAPASLIMDDEKATEVSMLLSSPDDASPSASEQAVAPIMQDVLCKLQSVQVSALEVCRQVRLTGRYVRG